MRSLMYFAEGSDGKINYGVMGGFADRMQLAAHTLLRALTGITERIVDAGDVGYTSSPPIQRTYGPPPPPPRPDRPYPRDLKGSP